MKLFVRILFIGFTFLSYSVFSQEWANKLNDPKANFYDVQQEFNQYWKDKTPEKGKGYKAFKRWENFMEQRVYPTGNRAVLNNLWPEYQNKLKTAKNNTTESSANWTPMGPVNVPANGLSYQSGGIGRLNNIAFSPGSSTTFWVGSPAGGLWKTTNGGTSWTSNTDALPNLGVSDIAIHPINPDTMFIATGDSDGSDTYSYGILRSTDGGLTWVQSGLTFNVTSYVKVARVIIHPTIPNILLAATTNGMYRSLNSGVNWTLVSNANYKSVEFKPGDPTVVYGATYDNSGAAKVYRSVNTGLNWSLASTGLPTSNALRIDLAVTPANSNYIYAVICNTSNGLNGVYRSTDSGGSWTLQTSTPNLLHSTVDGSGSGGQGWFDLTIAVSPLDANLVYVGGINIWKSTNGGLSFSIASHWYGDAGNPFVHADQHKLKFMPNTSTLFSCNDGGLAKTTNGASTWTTHSNTLSISQFYRIGTSATNGNLFYLGAQDNGTMRSSSSTWTGVYGGDGMECLVDYSNSNIAYVSTQNGSINRTTNGGSSFSNISSRTGAWVTPYIIHPTVPTTLFAGYENVYKTTDSGNSWTAISTNLTGSGSTYLRSLAIAPSNGNYIYAATYSKIWKSTNGGTSWVDITSGLPTSSASLTYITVSATNPDNIYVTFSGYSFGNKVFTSTNGGSSWNNYSTGLPNIPVNCIVYEKNTPDAVYIGTDLGVYYRNSTLSTWQDFSQGLPNVEVSELEIQYSNKKIYAASYGRGLWSSNLFSLITNDAGMLGVTSPAQNSCPGNLSVKANLTNYSTTVLNNVTVNWSVNGVIQPVVNWVGSLSTGSQVIVTLGNYSFTSNPSSYTIQTWTTLPNGSVDVDPSNDSVEAVLEINNNVQVFVSSNPTSICAGKNTNLSSQVNNLKENLKITEVSQFITGTGQTPVIPPYFNATGGVEDFVEISNLSAVAPLDVSGVLFELWKSTSMDRFFSIPNGTILPPQSTLILHLGTGTDNLPNLFFNTGGLTNSLVSADLAGFVIKKGGVVIDAAATNGYAFPAFSLVTTSDWSGSVSNSAGRAGIIRTASTDNNTAANWIPSNTPSPLQSLGTYNGIYTPFVVSVSSYVWSPSTYLSSTSSASPTASNVTNSITYLLNINTPTGCGASTSYLLNVNQNPSSVVAANSPVCTGDSLRLNATGGIAYSWTGPNGFSSVAQNPILYAPSSIIAGTYNVTVFGNFGCTTTKSVSVSVKSAGLTGVSSNSPVCEGANLNLIATGTGSFLWTGPNSYSTITKNPTITNVTLNKAGLYNLKITDTSGCVIIKNIIVDVNPSPQNAIATASSTSICKGSSVNLDINAQISGVQSVLFSHDFNASNNGWSGVNSSTGLNIADAAWTLRASPYLYTTETFNSGDAQFYLSNSDAQGAGSVTNTFLTSPAFSTLNYSSLWLKFNHHYKAFTADSALVQISTNGTSWITLKSYSTNQGSTQTFVSDSVNITTYAGLPTVFIRYRYYANYGWFWAIDNPTVYGLSTPAQISYSWTSNTSGYTSFIKNPVGVVTNSTTIYTGKVINSLSGCFGTASVTVNIKPKTLVISSNSPVCLGNSLQLFSSAGLGYQWTGPNGFSSAIRNPTISNITSADAGDYIISHTDLSGCIYEDTLKVLVSNNIVPSIVIQTSTPTICSGTSVTFLASAANGGTSPIYTWRVNSTVAGTNSPIFTSNTLGNNDVVTCEMQSSDSCAAPKKITSNGISMSVTPSVSPSISVLPSANTICSGESVTFVSTTNNQGTNPVYTWKVNNVIKGTNSPFFTYTLFQNNDVVTCELTSNALCASPLKVTSAGITMTVNPILTPTISVVAPKPVICLGESLVLKTSFSNQGVSPVFAWFKNGNAIANSNADTLSISNPSANDTYSCLLTINAPCFTVNSANSNVVQLNVVNPIKPTIARNGMILSTVLPAISYQWFMNNNKLIPETNSTLNVTVNGFYQVLTKDTSSCFAMSDSFNVNNVAVSTLNKLHKVTLWPNPTQNQLYFAFDGIESISVQIMSVDGKVMLRRNKMVHGDKLNLDGILSDGVYFVHIIYDNALQVEKLIKVRN